MLDSTFQIDEKLNTKLRTLNEEVKNRKNLQQTILQRANHAESEFHTLEERIKGLEGELLAADVDRDHLKEERSKVGIYVVGWWSLGNGNYDRF